LSKESDLASSESTPRKHVLVSKVKSNSLNDPGGMLYPKKGKGGSSGQKKGKMVNKKKVSGIEYRASFVTDQDSVKGVTQKSCFPENSSNRQRMRCYAALSNTMGVEGQHVRRKLQEQRKGPWEGKPSVIHERVKGVN